MVKFALATSFLLGLVHVSILGANVQLSVKQCIDANCIPQKDHDDKRLPEEASIREWNSEYYEHVQFVPHPKYPINIKWMTFGTEKEFHRQRRSAQLRQAEKFPDKQRMVQELYEVGQVLKDKRVAILIHGLDFKAVEKEMSRLAKLFWQRNYNVITVDWHYYMPNHPIGAANTRGIAQQIRKHIIDPIVEKTQIPLSDFHLVGMGLGAHIAGMIGKKYRVSGKRMRTIDAFAPRPSKKPRKRKRVKTGSTTERPIEKTKKRRRPRDAQENNQTTTTDKDIFLTTFKVKSIETESPMNAEQSNSTQDPLLRQVKKFHKLRSAGPEIGRITGLNPARKFFEYDDGPSEIRLTESDAIFVDVYHTDYRGKMRVGMLLPAGTVDFYAVLNQTLYPNCEGSQLDLGTMNTATAWRLAPSKLKKYLSLCSNEAALKMLIKSMDYTNQIYLARRKESDKCTDQNCIPIGLFARTFVQDGEDDFKDNRAGTYVFTSLSETIPADAKVLTGLLAKAQEEYKFVKVENDRVDRVSTTAKPSDTNPEDVPVETPETPNEEEAPAEEEEEEAAAADDAEEEKGDDKK